MGGEIKIPVLEAAVGGAVGAPIATAASVAAPISVAAVTLAAATLAAVTLAAVPVSVPVHAVPAAAVDAVPVAVLYEITHGGLVCECLDPPRHPERLTTEKEQKTPRFLTCGRKGVATYGKKGLLGCSVAFFAGAPVHD